MNQMPQERLILAVNAVAQTEKAVRLTLEYALERKVFGKPLYDKQNTRFVLAECATLATAARLFVDHCITAHAQGRLDNATAAMAKWWLTDVQCKVLDECVQLFGGYGYMEEYPIARMYADSPRAEDLRRGERSHEGNHCARPGRRGTKCPTALMALTARSPWLPAGPAASAARRRRGSPRRARASSSPTSAPPRSNEPRNS
jgi:alkylation response protein AidB-like acyl-CoA dehydrogenase